MDNFNKLMLLSDQYAEVEEAVASTMSIEGLTYEDRDAIFEGIYQQAEYTIESILSAVVSTIRRGIEFVIDLIKRMINAIINFINRLLGRESGRAKDNEGLTDTLINTDNLHPILKDSMLNYKEEQSPIERVTEIMRYAKHILKGGSSREFVRKNTNEALKVIRSELTDGERAAIKDKSTVEEYRKKAVMKLYLETLSKLRLLADNTELKMSDVFDHNVFYKDPDFATILADKFFNSGAEDVVEKDILKLLEGNELSIEDIDRAIIDPFLQAFSEHATKIENSVVEEPETEEELAKKRLVTLVVNDPSQTAVEYAKQSVSDLAEHVTILENIVTMLTKSMSASVSALSGASIVNEGLARGVILEREVYSLMKLLVRDLEFKGGNSFYDESLGLLKDSPLDITEATLTPPSRPNVNAVRFRSKMQSSVKKKLVVDVFGEGVLGKNGVDNPYSDMRVSELSEVIGAVTNKYSSELEYVTKQIWKEESLIAKVKAPRLATSVIAKLDNVRTLTVDMDYAGDDHVDFFNDLNSRSDQVRSSMTSLRDKLTGLRKEYTKYDSKMAAAAKARPKLSKGNRSRNGEYPFTDSSVDELELGHFYLVLKAMVKYRNKLTGNGYTDKTSEKDRVRIFKENLSGLQEIVSDHSYSQTLIYMDGMMKSITNTTTSVLSHIQKILLIQDRVKFVDVVQLRKIQNDKSVNARLVRVGLGPVYDKLKKDAGKGK